MLCHTSTRPLSMYPPGETDLQLVNQDGDRVKLILVALSFHAGEI